MIPEQLHLAEYERTIAELKSRLHVLEKRIEAYEWVCLCAAEVVEVWPTLTFRTIRNMISIMDTLKEALIKVKIG